MMLIRSLLFVPGNRPERFAKALASKADLICIDLEDAVPVADKQQAAAQVLAFLQQANPADFARLAVRINALSTAAGQQDLNRFSSFPPAYLMLAKCQSAAEVQTAASALQQRSKLIALLESISGLQQATQIAQSSPELVALMFGGADLSAELGCEFSYEPLLLSRLQLVQAAASASLQLIDVPFLALDDEEGLQAETRRCRALGFTGKAAIHPKQLSGIHAALKPAAEQLAYAQQVLAAAEIAGADSVFVVNGKMVDRPVYLACQRIVAYARDDAAE